MNKPMKSLLGVLSIFAIILIVFELVTFGAPQIISGEGSSPTVIEMTYGKYLRTLGIWSFIWMLSVSSTLWVSLENLTCLLQSKQIKEIKNKILIVSSILSFNLIVFLRLAFNDSLTSFHAVSATTLETAKIFFSVQTFNSMIILVIGLFVYCLSISAKNK